MDTAALMNTLFNSRGRGVQFASTYSRRTSTMKKSFFEQMGGTYTQMGNHRLPSLELPPEKEQSIGVWGQRRLRYLKQHQKGLYYNLLTSGKLYSHIADTEKQAQQLFLRLVNEYAANEGITEQLKATDPMAWVQQMNDIRERVTETVNAEVVFV